MKFYRILLLAIVPFVFGCGQNEDAIKLADAQACMNNATTKTASKCMALLKGVSGERAALMRCSIKFIEEGFDKSDRLIKVISAMEDDSDGGNPTLSAMAFLAFQAGEDSATNKSNAAEAEELCALTGAPGYIMLASFAHIATNFISAAGDAGLTLEPGEVPTKEQMEDIADFLKDPSNETEAGPIATAIGATVISTYQNSCTAGESDDFCDDLAEAMKDAGENPDPEAIGQALIAHLRANP